MSDQTKPNVSARPKKSRKRTEASVDKGTKSPVKAKNNVDIPSLIQLVAMATELKKNPDIKGSALMSAVSKTKDTGAYSKFWAKMKPWLRKPVFKEKLMLHGEVLWDEVQPRDRQIAKQSFPEAKFARGGLNVYGENVVAATKLYLHLISVAREINRPLAEALPSFAAAQVDTERLNKELSERGPSEDEYYDVGHFKEPKPWDYHKIKDGRRGFEFRSISPIPEAWKKCVELPDRKIEESFDERDADGAALGGMFAKAAAEPAGQL